MVCAYGEENMKLSYIFGKIDGDMIRSSSCNLQAFLL